MKSLESCSFRLARFRAHLGDPTADPLTPLPCIESSEYPGYCVHCGCSLRALEPRDDLPDAVKDVESLYDVVVSPGEEARLLRLLGERVGSSVDNDPRMAQPPTAPPNDPALDAFVSILKPLDSEKRRQVMAASLCLLHPYLSELVIHEFRRRGDG